MYPSKWQLHTSSQREDKPAVKTEPVADEADGPPEVSDEVSGLTSYHWAA